MCNRDAETCFAAATDAQDDDGVRHLIGYRCHLVKHRLMMPTPNRRGIKQCLCLTSVGLSRTLGLSREQRGLGRPKLAQR